jgi:hypothetical protein
LRRGFNVRTAGDLNPEKLELAKCCRLIWMNGCGQRASKYPFRLSGTDLHAVF